LKKKTRGIGRCGERNKDGAREGKRYSNLAGKREKKKASTTSPGRGRDLRIPRRKFVLLKERNSVVGIEESNGCRSGGKVGETLMVKLREGPFIISIGFYRAHDERERGDVCRRLNCKGRQKKKKKNLENKQRKRNQALLRQPKGGDERLNFLRKGSQPPLS